MTERITPVPEDRWDDDVIATFRAGAAPWLYARFFVEGPDRVPVPKVLTTLAHHPGLAIPFLDYNAKLLRDPVISERLRELVVMRIALRTQSEYEWTQHARIARRLEFTPEDIQAIVDGPSSEHLPPLERAALAAADEMLDDYCVSDETWKTLSEHFDDRGLLELAFVIGTYACLSMVFNSIGLSVDTFLDTKGLPPLPPTPPRPKREGAA